MSPNLPLEYPYLFSNKSDQLLCEKGLVFGEEIGLALTGSNARELAAIAAVESAASSQEESVAAAQTGEGFVSQHVVDTASPQAHVADQLHRESAELDELPAELFVEQRC